MSAAVSEVIKTVRVRCGEGEKGRKLINRVVRVAVDARFSLRREDAASRWNKKTRDDDKQRGGRCQVRIVVARVYSFIEAKKAPGGKEGGIRVVK